MFAARFIPSATAPDRYDRPCLWPGGRAFRPAAAFPTGGHRPRGKRARLRRIDEAPARQVEQAAWQPLDKIGSERLKPAGPHERAQPVRRRRLGGWPEALRRDPVLPRLAGRRNRRASLRLPRRRGGGRRHGPAGRLVRAGGLCHGLPGRALSAGGLRRANGFSRRILRRCCRLRAALRHLLPHGPPGRRHIGKRVDGGQKDLTGQLLVPFGRPLCRNGLRLGGRPGRRDLVRHGGRRHPVGSRLCGRGVSRPLRARQALAQGQRGVFGVQQASRALPDAKADHQRRGLRAAAEQQQGL